MGKIKGWTKIGKERWAFKKDPRIHLYIDEVNAQVLIEKGNEPPKRIYRGRIITEVRRKATAYMRSHPNG